jgi:hypothetical protein
MAALLVALVLASALPVLLPILSNVQILPGYRISVIACVFNALLQIAFIVLVERQSLQLNSSLKFAAVGIPCCILALITARRGDSRGKSPRGAIASASLGLAMWMILITLH